MKVTRVYDQIRRDCSCDLECENCKSKMTIKTAYDDRNYWDNVIPAVKCKQCGKSTKDMNIQPIIIPTKYSPYEIV